jgi:hypothetical protein
MRCHLCEAQVPLIEAHIIPRPFFRAYGRGRGPRVISNSPGVNPKRAPAGFYDASILCGPCDRRIGVWDQYGAELFIDGLSEFKPFPNARSPIALVRPSFDFDRLRLFVLSVLWRAGISSLPMFQRVRLGRYGDRLREMLRAEDPGQSDEFCTVLSVFTVNGGLPTVSIPMADPFRERWNGTNAYRISFGLVTAYVKTDQRSFPFSLGSLAIKEGHPLYLIERDFSSSPEAKVIRSMVSAPQNRRLFKKR